MFVCFSFRSVQARLVENLDSDAEPSGKYFIEHPDYSNLLTFLKSRKPISSKHNNDNNNNDNNNNNKQNKNDLNLSKDEQLSLQNRRFFLLEFLRPKQGGRTSTTYGRKSHWDTFFGKK